MGGKPAGSGKENEAMEATRVLLRDVVAGAAVPLTGASQDYDALLELIGDSRFVLLGEASHGTLGRNQPSC